MNELRWPAKLYIAAVSLAAAGLTALSILLPVGAPDRVPTGLAWMFGGLMTAAWLFPLPLSYKRKLYLDTCVLIAAILLFQPVVAMLIAGGGTALSHLIRRQDGVQAAFNSAQIMLQAGLGGLIVATGVIDADRSLFAGPEQAMILVVASTVIFLVDNILVSTMVGLDSELALLPHWYQTILSANRVQYLSHLAQVSLGVIAAILSDAYPWTLPLLFLPAVAIYRLLEHNVRLRGQAEAALLASDHNLADAQRIARLGSWEWDLVTDTVRWSAEAYRIAGVDPHDFVPAGRAGLLPVHPEDRAMVAQAVEGALQEGRAFSVEHRLPRPDGSERVVHLQGEVVVDDQTASRRVVGTVQDITERKALEAQLAHQAFHDALTLLPNRAAILNRLGRALEETQQGHGEVAVLFLDLDRFKVINDSLNHEAGDQALIEVAQRLLRCVGPADMVARFGGDEFIVLLAGANTRAAKAAAERISMALRAPLCLLGHETFLSASIGIAVSADGLTRAGDLLQAADTALYRAKEEGRGTSAVFQPNMHQQAVARLEMEIALQPAVERGEFQLSYQPEVELATGQIVSVEALVRWERPSYGLVVPDEFIPLAEETGLILSIGEWVLTEACRQIQVGVANHLDPKLIVSVNLSALQLRQPDIAHQVERALQRTGLPPHRLKLEVTEKVLVEDLDTTANALAALKSLGVRLAIDDFGAGYSSIGYLRRLAVDTLKIDRSVVEGMGSNPKDQAIVEAITSLAHTIGMEVTAEGIETSDQLTRVLALDCDIAQGYYFSPPLPFEELSPILTSTLPFDLIQDARAELRRSPLTPAREVIARNAPTPARLTPSRQEP